MMLGLFYEYLSREPKFYVWAAGVVEQGAGAVGGASDPSAEEGFQSCADPGVFSVEERRRCRWRVGHLHQQINVCSSSGHQSRFGIL